MSYDVPGLDWSGERMLPAFQPVQRLTIYDVRGVAPDLQLAATTYAGLINRPEPRIYLLGRNDDLDWLKQVASSIPQTQASATGATLLPTMLDAYRECAQGLIIYDPSLVDTINIATTLAGQRDGIVVSPALAEELQASHQLPVLADLRTYGWRTRLQAYQWAQQNLLSGSSARLLAGMGPQIMSCLRSFLVATRTFVYWLDSRNYLPDLSVGLLSERGLMEQLYSGFAPGSVHLGWFVHEPTGVTLTSRAAMIVLASDFFNNLEVWTALPLHSDAPSSPPSQNDVPAPGGAASATPHSDSGLSLSSLPIENATPHSDSGLSLSSPIENVATRSDSGSSLSLPRAEALAQESGTANDIYLSFTMSDGDNLQFCQHRLRDLWRDSARGSLPIGWTIAPSLPQAAPALAQYYLHSATPNDEFIAGPSGAGYMFPSCWPAEHLDVFLQRTGQLLQAMNISTLEVLDSDFLYSLGLPLVSQFSLTGMAFTQARAQQAFANALAPYGVQGMLSGAGFWFANGSWKQAASLPLYQNLGVADTADRVVWLVQKAAAAHKQRPLFLSVYIVAWSLGPSHLQQIMQRLGAGYQVVLPQTLLSMLAKTL